MSEETNHPLQKTELELLKERAKMMGLKFHPATGIEKMRVIVADAMPNKPSVELEVGSKHTKIPYETQQQREARLRKAASQLVRVRVTNMNARTKDLPGQIYTAGNSFCTFKKYIPFNAPNGFHIPQILLNFIDDKKCQVFYTTLDKKGRKVRKGKLVKEFNIEVLPALTMDEIKQLASEQALREASE